MATKFNAAFWKWFGDSKVVDAKGQPLVVYHGTRANFEAFNQRANELSPRGDSGALGFHFTPDKRAAEYYGREGLKAVFLSIQNPAILSDAEFRRSTNSRRDAAQLRADLERRGHDGAVTPLQEIVAFYPQQIKSVDNDGTWDADDPDIRSNPARVLNVPIKDLDYFEWYLPGGCSERHATHEAMTCQESIADLANKMTHGLSIEPIEIMRADTGGKKWLVMDGHHRVNATIIAGLATIPAIEVRSNADDPDIRSNPRLAWKEVRRYKGSDGGSYIDLALGGIARNGLLTVELDTRNGYQVRNVFVALGLMRQGYASEAYAALAQKSLEDTGRPLRSSEIGYGRKSSKTTMSPDAVALWESFVRKGMAQKAGDHYVMDGLVEVGSKGNPPCGASGDIVAVRRAAAADWRSEAANAKSLEQRERYAERASLLERSAATWELVEDALASLGLRECESSRSSEARYYKVGGSALKVRVAEHPSEHARSLRNTAAEILISYTTGRVTVLSGQALRDRYTHWWSGVPPAESDAIGKAISAALEQRFKRARK